MNSNEIYIAASGIIKLVQVGAVVFEFALNAMDAIEKSKHMSGAEKKSWVMAKIKDVIIDNKFDIDEWLDKISKFIDDVISSFNSFKYLF